MNVDNIRKVIRYLNSLLTGGVDSLIGRPTVDTLTGLDFITEQLRELLIMAACGACIAYIFTVYNGFIKRSFPTGRRNLPVILLDMIFCIIAGVIISRFWFKSSFGRLSLHEGTAFMFGLFSGIKTFAFVKSKRVHTISVIYVILVVIAYYVIS
jgi:hypothetical protein